MKDAIKAAPTPETVDAAVELLYDNLEPSEIEFVLDEPQESAIHFSFGMYMRNSWGLWDLKSPISVDFQKRFGLFGHGDDISGMILTGLWAKVHGVPLSYEDVARRYRKHWYALGVDLKTGKLKKEGKS